MRLDLSSRVVAALPIALCRQYVGTRDRGDADVVLALDRLARFELRCCSVSFNPMITHFRRLVAPLICLLASSSR